MAIGKDIYGGWLEVLIAPGAIIEIKGENTALPTWEVKSDLKEQQEQITYAERIKAYELALHQTLARLVELEGKERSTPDVTGQRQLQIDSLNTTYKTLQEEITRQQLQSMRESDILGVYGMNRLLWYSWIFCLNSSGPEIYREQLCHLYEALSPEQKQNELGKEIALYLYPPRIAKEGDEMVDAGLFDIDGNRYQLSDYTGMYRLLYFWNAECIPSQQGISSLAKRCEKYNGQLVIVGIHTEGIDSWEKFSREKEFPFINLSDGKTDKGIVLQYAVRGTPSYIIISPDNLVLRLQIDFQDGILEKDLEEHIR